MKKEQGQTLVEFLLALGLVVLIVTSITIATISSVNNTNLSKTQNLATQYAQEGIEITRRLRDTNYATFSTLSGLYCLAKNCSTINKTTGDPCGPSAQCNVNVDNFFIRQVRITPNAANCTSATSVATSVTAVVKWTDGKCTTGNFCHNVAIVSCLTGSNIVPSP